MNAALSRHLFRVGALYPFLREPIERLECKADDDIDGLATDGVSVYYSPDASPPAEAVAHMLIHCLFRHLIPPKGAVQSLWDLACDLSAEFLRTELFPGQDAGPIRRQIADALPEGVDPRVAVAVYRALLDCFEDELEPLAIQFHRDDHRYWYAPPHEGQFETQGAKGTSGYREWVEAALETCWPPEAAFQGGGAASTGRWGLAPGSRQERMLLKEEGKYDFSRYLRRFSTTREELRLDMDSFDYIPYYYGLLRYGHMPMIEPLEYAECRRVETLVIAIDTSGSCSAPVVERFLGEIQGILLDHDNFFARMNVHILQCDAIVQSHVVIHSREEWRKYTRALTIRGRGGTSFIPVFTLVEKLRRQGALPRLKGLLYFTDGDGVYPQQPTPYETAFVFSTRRALERHFPDWIVPLCLE